MSRVALLVGLALLVAMVTAALLEWTSRVRCRMNALRRSSPLRMLDDRERAALATLRVLTGCIHDDQVRVLTGAFTGGSRRANYPVCDGQLAGIPVLMPRQAWSHLADHNDAEVVMARHWAVVVRLNGFEVASLRRPAAARIHGERRETPAEVAMRRGPGLRPAALPITALALWAAVDLSGVAALFMVLIAAGTAWLAWPRRRGPATTQRVLQLQGQLQAYRQRSDVGPVWLLGADRRVQLPWEWADARAFAQRRSMRLEVRADDGAVLGAGPGWCLARDRQRFPPAGGLWQLAWLSLLLLLLLAGWLGDLRWLPVAAVLAAWHALRCILAIRQSLRRNAARTADIAQRANPGH
ncbi:hypothetical protein IAE57_04915 [Stenotrophomonas sp. S48]|uniref:hypothetical protein n=1 Tax=unclassified Stenotrophomonas TaxID=196198 RepID=UPI001901FCEB|nr:MULTISPECIES: hypothetical protein [unclassified Stenotrophomonas]MBK0025489.1 hypothetical protein [Stenotrophomonas sp. S48]MBK0047532.1 hypothetical protein [Stenotrophomonas sp. S49]